MHSSSLMQKKCACGGIVQQKNMPDISYNPIQQCTDCGTVFINKRMLEEVGKAQKRRKYLA